jgi:hypothetical protein
MQHWRRHRWIAFLDADEFLVLHPSAASATSDARRTRRNHLGLFMADYEQDKLGALGVNWVLFGSSGLERRPEQGPLAAYTKCIPRAHDESRHVKVGNAPGGREGGRQGGREGELQAHHTSSRVLCLRDVSRAAVCMW